MNEYFKDFSSSDSTIIRVRKNEGALVMLVPESATHIVLRSSSIYDLEEFWLDIEIPE